MAEREGWETKHENPIECQVPGHRSEVDPAEDEGEGDQHCQDAAPHDKHVCQTTRPAPPPDEQVQEEHADETNDEMPEAAPEVPLPQEGLPAAPPVPASRRPL